MSQLMNELMNKLEADYLLNWCDEKAVMKITMKVYELQDWKFILMVQTDE